MHSLHCPRLVSSSAEAHVITIGGPVLVLMTVDGSNQQMQSLNCLDMQLSIAPESKRAVASVLPTLALCVDFCISLI